MMRSLVAALVLCASSPALGAGMYFTDRGVRPMGRAGAFVAGADDLGAIWYNPAGITDAGSSVLVDFSYLRFGSTYDRELLIADASDTLTTVRSPRVEGSSSFMPLPTLAGSVAVSKKFSVAGGLYSPYMALPHYPDTAGGEPSPARYMLGSFAGSKVALPGVWIAARPRDALRLGIGVQALVGTLESTLTFSVSPPDRLIGAPEQPDYDAAGKVSIGPIFAPSVSGGVVVEPHRAVRIGVSAQSPSHIEAGAKLAVRLPQSAVFDRARVSGDSARVALDLPGILRAGVEVRPVPALRVEATYVREFWSVHKAIKASPEGITLDGMVGAPPSVPMPDIDSPRNFRDADSIRLGGEYAFGLGRVRASARAGVGYETSAVPVEYVSLASLDFDKTTLTFGASVHVSDRWRLDALYGRVFASEAYVAPDRAAIGRINPLSDNAPFEAVNGGRYAASSDLIGLGLNYTYQ